MSKILACIDTSPYANSVCDLTAWAATRLSSPVEVLHVIQRKSAVQERRDHTGASGLGGKSGLLEELTHLEEAQGKLAIETGRSLLETAAEQLRAAGVQDVAVTHRHGGIVETILEREEDCDLLVMGNRGASAEVAIAHLGSKIDRVLSASTKPILSAPLEVGAINKVVYDYDGGRSAKRELEVRASSPLYEKLTLHPAIVGQDKDVNIKMIVHG